MTTADEAKPSGTRKTSAKRRSGSTRDDLQARLASMLGDDTGSSAAPAADAKPARASKPRTRRAAKPATATDAPAAPPPARQPAAPRQQQPKPSMPAEQPTPVFYSSRINLTVTPDMLRTLRLAKVDDGIDATARIRAMIQLWEDDEKLRRRIDKLARSMQ